MEQNNPHILGALVMGQLPSFMQEAVYEFCRGTGAGYQVEAAAAHSQLIGGGRPLMGYFIPDTIENVAALLAGSSAYHEDALAATWSVDKFKLLFKRQGISDALAQQIAERVFTPDSGSIDYAITLLNYIPDLPTEIDDMAKSALARALNYIGINVASSLTTGHEDTLWECLQAGRELIALRQRAKYKLSGNNYAGITPEAPKKADGSVDLSGLASVASTVLPLVFSLISKRVGGGGSGGYTGSGRQLTGDVDETSTHGDLTNLTEAGKTIIRFARNPQHAGDVEELQNAIGDVLEHAVAVQPDIQTGDFLSDAASAIANISTGGLAGLATKAISGLGSVLGKKGGGSSTSPQVNADIGKLRAEVAKIRQQLTGHATASKADAAAIQRLITTKANGLTALIHALGGRIRIVGPMTAAPIPEPSQ